MSWSGWTVFAVGRAGIGRIWGMSGMRGFETAIVGFLTLVADRQSQMLKTK
jgi:hypothetical protein